MELYHLGLLQSIDGVQTNARGLRCEIMSTQKATLEKLCIEGIWVKGMHVRFMPSYIEELQVFFTNVPLEADNDELEEMMKKQGGKIISTERNYRTIKDCQFYTGLRMVKINDENFKGLPTHAKAFEGRTIGIKYKGQETHNEQTDRTQQHKTAPHTRPIQQFTFHPPAPALRPSLTAFIAAGASATTPTHTSTHARYNTRPRSSARVTCDIRQGTNIDHTGPTGTSTA